MNIDTFRKLVQDFDNKYNGLDVDNFMTLGRENGISTEDLIALAPEFFEDPEAINIIKEDLTSPSSVYGPTGIANPADYINNELNVGDNVPGYENSYVDGGVLSGMLTDRDDIRNAAINWMKSLKGNDRAKLDNILNDKNFKDMYGDIDFELGKEETE